MSSIDPTTFLAPDQPFFVDGLDWSWAFVVHRAIDGFGNYSVGSDGSVWSRAVIGRADGISGRWRRLKPVIRKTGHENVFLGHGNTRSVHRLVLEAFVGPCPSGMECCHNDGNPRNNRVRNLRWGTDTDNAADQREHGVRACGRKIWTAKVDEDRVREIRSLKRSGLSLTQLAARFGVTASHMSRIASGKAWRHVP
jgi:hypothetical protein